MVSAKMIYPVVALFTLAIFLFNIFNIAGSASGHLTNVYMGQASVRHINVTKILPNVAPVVNVFAKSLTAPNINSSVIFDAMVGLGESAALKPVLSLLTNTKNMDATMSALLTLTPLTLSNSSTQLSNDIALMVANTNNQTLLLETLSSLGSVNVTSAMASLTPVMKLLHNSDNITATLESLNQLNSYSSALPATELQAILSLLGVSTNLTATLTDFQILSNASSSINSTVETQIFTAIETSTNVTNTLTMMYMAADSTSKPFIAALSDILVHSSNGTATLVDLSTIMTAQQTQIATKDTTALAASAYSLKALTTLLTTSENTTITLQTLPTLLASTTSDSAAELADLQSVLENSKNVTLGLELMYDLETFMAKPAAASMVSSAIPAFIKLLSSSTNSSITLASLGSVSTLAQSNASTMIPIGTILSAYKNSQNVTEAYIEEHIMPEMFNRMHFATDFRLGIQSLCRYNTHGVLYSCTKAHSVQAFFMKDILYHELETSLFDPYVKALGITVNDVIIKGDLMKKQHLYVPGVRALLAFGILAFIFAFIIMVGCVVPAFKNNKKFNKLNALILSPLLFINCLLASIIIGVLCHMIKSGVKHDKYNVTFAYGSAFWGLSWTSFVLSILVVLLSFAAYKKNSKQEKIPDAENVQHVESRQDSSDVSHEGIEKLQTGEKL